MPDADTPHPADRRCPACAAGIATGDAAQLHGSSAEKASIDRATGFDGRRSWRSRVRRPGDPIPGASLILGEDFPDGGPAHASPPRSGAGVAPSGGEPSRGERSVPGGSQRTHRSPLASAAASGRQPAPRGVAEPERKELHLPPVAQPAAVVLGPERRVSSPAPSLSPASRRTKSAPSSPAASPPPSSRSRW